MARTLIRPPVTLDSTPGRGLEAALLIPWSEERVGTLGDAILTDGTGIARILFSPLTTPDTTFGRGFRGTLLGACKDDTGSTEVTAIAGVGTAKILFNPLATPDITPGRGFDTELLIP